MAAGKSIIEKLWDELDEVTAYLIENKPGKEVDGELQEEYDEYQLKRGHAQGLGIALQMMSVPHFPDVTSVAKWAARRYKMAKGLKPHEPTPGCDGHNPMPPSSAPRSEAAKAPAKQVTPPAELKPLSESDMTLVENAVKAKFPDSSIMSLVKGVTQAHIDEVRKRVHV